MPPESARGRRQRQHRGGEKVTKAYVVTDGWYEDHRVVAVYSSEQQAQELEAMLERSPRSRR